MRKKGLIMLLFGLALTAGIASQAKEIIRNGDFKQLIPTPAKRKKFVSSDKFIKGWGVGTPTEIISEEGKPNKVRFKDGVIYSYMLRSWNAPAAEAQGIIIASGPGKLKITLSTCIKKNAKQPFSHSKKTVIGEFKLSDKTETLKFKYKFAAGEVGYIYISGPATVNSISLKTIETEK
jgi:hypothetical protein